MMHGSGGAEPFNSVQCDPDLNLDCVCASEDEGIDAGVLLQRVQRQFDLPALPTDVGAIGLGKASIGNNDGVSPRLIIGFDIPHKEVPPIAEDQLLPSDDFMELHAPAVGGGTGLRNPVICVAPDGAKELLRAQNDLAREVVQQVLQATHATSAAFGLCLKEGWLWEATAGDSASEIREMLNTGSGFAGVSASSGTLQSCGNTLFDSRPDAEACRRLGIRAVVVMPLANKHQLLGLVAVFSRRPYAFGMRDLQALQNLTEEFTAKLQVSAKSGNVNTRRASPFAFESSALHQQSGYK